MLRSEISPEKSCIPSNIPIKERLLEERQQLMSKVDEINRAFVLLDKNPDTEDLINILNRLNY